MGLKEERRIEFLPGPDRPLQKKKDSISPNCVYSTSSSLPSLTQARPWHHMVEAVFLKEKKKKTRFIRMTFREHDWRGSWPSDHSTRPAVLRTLLVPRHLGLTHGCCQDPMPDARVAFTLPPLLRTILWNIPGNPSTHSQHPKSFDVI